MGGAYAPVMPPGLLRGRRAITKDSVVDLPQVLTDRLRLFTRSSELAQLIEIAVAKLVDRRKNGTCVLLNRSKLLEE